MALDVASKTIQNGIVLDRVTKRFAGVTALDDVSLAIVPGSCHALVGENGAGKSTLGKILAGVHSPDGGRVWLDGRSVRFRSPSDAVAEGIGIVHQERTLCPNLSVAENLFLGRLPSRRGFVETSIIRREASCLLEQVGLIIDPDVLAGDLSTAQEQLVQIARAVGSKARVVIFDEPTSALSGAEAERLFEIITRLRDHGATILYVSHKLEEIFRLCDAVTVLRDGRHVGTQSIGAVTREELVRMMIGRPLSESSMLRSASPQDSEVMLSVVGLASAGKFSGISFTIRAGEVVGLAGLVGSGRSEIARAIFGLDPMRQGTINVRSSKVTINAPWEAIACGIGLLPEDRQTEGLILGMSGCENLTLTVLDSFKRRLMIDCRKERAVARGFFERLGIRVSALEIPVSSLSGGNQQKVALSKWLAARCPILILDEPTRGVDVGAKEEIHQLIENLAAAGHAILLISSDMPELLRISTRLLVMREGRMTGELTRTEATQERLLQLMTGAIPPTASS